MTKAAKHFGKHLSDFWKNDSTRAYMLSLAESLELIRGKSPITHGASICGDIKDQLVEARKGWHENPDVGTWAHPKLAVFFARWLDVRFAVWCDAHSLVFRV